MLRYIFDNFLLLHPSVVGGRASALQLGGNIVLYIGVGCIRTITFDCRFTFLVHSGIEYVHTKNA